jgi:hypothetical protein
VSRSAGIVDHAPAVSERAFPAGQASVRRVHMRDRVTIGQWWKTKRRRDGPAASVSARSTVPSGASTSSTVTASASS